MCVCVCDGSKQYHIRLSHSCHCLLLSESRQAVQQDPASCDNTHNAYWFREREQHDKENWIWQKTTSDEPPLNLISVWVCLSGLSALLQWYIRIYCMFSPVWLLCLFFMCVVHLLCDGKANDWVSLGDVPCHHSRVCFQCSDGHIDRRRQAICKQTERKAKAGFIICAMKQMRAAAEMATSRTGSQIQWCE